MSWRLARSLEVLRSQVNAALPHRDKSSDGSIGDEAHSARTSDHNPDTDGVVKAIDITHDPRGGFDSYAFADELRAIKDSRIKYIISNRKIASGTDQGQPAWVWRKYTGSNPHDHHVHISVKRDSEHYDDTRLWDIAEFFGGAPQPHPAEPDVPKPSSNPVLMRGVIGHDVERLQSLLNKHGARLAVDGGFGPATDAAVREFQTINHLVADGIVGGYTWRALMAGLD